VGQLGAELVHGKQQHDDPEQAEIREQPEDAAKQFHDQPTRPRRSSAAIISIYLWRNSVTPTRESRFSGLAYAPLPLEVAIDGIADGLGHHAAAALRGEAGLVV